MVRSTALWAALVLLAAGLPHAGQAADMAMRRAPYAARTVVPVQDCVGPGVPDAFCRHYGYRRGTATYARCFGIIAGYGPGPALSNGYTINFDWTKTLPPRACRPPRLVIEPPQNRPL